MRNKNIKNKYFLIVFGIILGIFIGMLPARLGQQAKPEEKKTEEGTGSREKQSEEVSQSYVLKEVLAANTKYPAWDKEAVYTKGDQVTYKGKIYQAKWWTQGEKPDQSGEYGVWEYTGKAETKTENKSTASPKPEAVTAKTTASTSNKNFKVVAYYPSWKENGLSKLRFDIVTHVNYAFAIPTKSGGLRALENPSLAKKIVKLAHKNGAKALLAIGGWSYNGSELEPVFREATSTKAKRDKFVKAVIAMCDKYGFDGVDMDWEHPRKDDGTNKQYEAVMLSLSKKLHKKNKLLTSAVLSGVTPEGNVYYDAAAHTDKVLKAVDWINVMAYDGGDGERHSSYSFAVKSARYWKSTRKLPKSKVVLGVPFYGRPSWASYEDILANDKNAYKKDISIYNGMEAYYNGQNTIKKKTKYAKKNLGGIMIWEITQDTSNVKKSLLTAIGKEIGN